MALMYKILTLQLNQYMYKCQISFCGSYKD